MTTRQALGEQEIARRLSELSGWSQQDQTLVKDYRFASFVEAFGWMTQVALVAERMDHHPDWSNVYNRVRVQLSTHDANGITGLDFELAAHMDALAR